MMLAAMSGVLRILAAVISGLLVALLFPPYSIYGLAWVAMLPLLWALGSLQGKRAGWKGFALGFLAGAVSCLIQFNWLTTVSWLGAVLLPLYLAIYWGLFGVFAAAWGKMVPGKCLRLAFCQAAVWAGLEWFRGWLFTGFAWNVLGVGFHEYQDMSQAADLFGVGGLSLMLVFVQAMLLQSFTEMSHGKSRRYPELAVVVLLVGGLFGYGKWRIHHEAAAASIPLKALLVQVNVPQEAAHQLWTDLEVHQAYEDETLAALAKLKAADGTRSADWPDWVIWPETALTGRILKMDDGEWATSQTNLDTLDQVNAAGPFSLIFGANELEPERIGNELEPKIRGKAYNSIAVATPGGQLETYRKRHLVIFGETIPFVESVPFLKSIYEQQSGMEFGGSFTPGESLDPLMIRVGNGKIGAIPTICFEDSVARLTRKFVRPGPQVIVNVTNDGWFKTSPAAAQHFANSRFRAIELRRPMLRCANTGVSGAIDSAGSTDDPNSWKRQILRDKNGSHFTRGSLLVHVKVPVQPSFSLYAAIGDWGIIGLAAVGLGLAWASRRTSIVP